MSNLPDDVSISDIPGNRPQDFAVDRLATACQMVLNHMNEKPWLKGEIENSEWDDNDPGAVVDLSLSISVTVRAKYQESARRQIQDAVATLCDAVGLEVVDGDGAKP